MANAAALITFDITPRALLCADMKLRPKGFTLIELLVVLVIMSLLTLAFLNSQVKYDSATIMRSLAYQVALSIRQAQVYGTSVARSSSEHVFPAYGISFGGDTNSYFIFANPKTTTATGQFDTGVTTVKSFSVHKSYAIAEVCAVTASNTWRCSGSADSSGTGSIKTLNIQFVRPNPDARITAFKTDNTAQAGDVYTTAYVQLRALNNDVRVIKIMAAGQITVCGIGNTSGTGITTLRLRTVTGLRC